MDRAGAIELLMPTLQLADLWRESGRYEDYGDEMLRIRDRHERELVYGPTAEEQITNVFRTYVRSYRDVPRILYNVQWKFRDERRPRFGVMRAREFLMKDAYSFDLDEAGARRSYNRMFLAYLNIFRRMGLSAIPVKADPGPIGGDLSHEFIVLATTGESQVYCDRRLVEMEEPGDLDWDGDLQAEVDRRVSLYAATEEMHDASRFESLPASARLIERGIEVGHIFYFGEKYSGPMKVSVAGQDGAERAIHGGSYGVGVSRLVAAIIESSHDAAGIIWPRSIAPFTAMVLNLQPNDPVTKALAEQAYQGLVSTGIEVLLDDTDERPGAKFARADLVGAPWQIIVGRSASDGRVELKRRATGERREIGMNEAVTEIVDSPWG
jgi:prolyl-tRNA synthetase